MKKTVGFKIRNLCENYNKKSNLAETSVGFLFGTNVDTSCVDRRRIACIAAMEQRKNAEERRLAVAEAGASSLDQLPEECVREILLRLSDSRDIITAGIGTQTHQ